MEDEAKVKLTFKYTEKEYVGAVRQLRFPNYTIQVISIFLSLLFLLGIYTAYISAGEWLISLILVFISLLGVAITLFFYFGDYKNYFREDETLREEYNIEFSKNEITSKSKSAESRFGWNVFKDFRETKQFYFLDYKYDGPLTIPKRVFTSPSQEKIFREFLITYINPKAKIKKPEEDYVPKSLNPPDWR